MSVRIIVDSASDLTKERADALNLDYMPLKTIFGETEYLDGVTISHKEFYEKLIECGTIPTTSQVSPHDFEAKFKEVKEAGDTAVVICLSSLLSGTYQSAHIALDGYEDCITLVDSLNVCLGEQILVLYAVKLRDEGLSAKEIAEKLEEKKKDVCVLAVFDTLRSEEHTSELQSLMLISYAVFCLKKIFFFNDTATTEIYTFSLHDALPIYDSIRFHSMIPFNSIR